MEHLKAAIRKVRNTANEVQRGNAKEKKALSSWTTPRVMSSRARPMTVRMEGIPLRTVAMAARGPRRRILLIITTITVTLISTISSLLFMVLDVY